MADNEEIKVNIEEVEALLTKSKEPRPAKINWSFNKWRRNEEQMLNVVAPWCASRAIWDFIGYD